VHILYLASSFVLILYWPDDGCIKPKHVAASLGIVIYDNCCVYEWFIVLNKRRSNTNLIENINLVNCDNVNLYIPAFIYNVIPCIKILQKISHKMKKGTEMCQKMRLAWTHVEGKALPQSTVKYHCFSCAFPSYFWSEFGWGGEQAVMTS
jgi:hypothetical protein